jgi:hypothetical protein
MKKITLTVLIFLAIHSLAGFAQSAVDGSYLWNSTNITCPLNDKTELIFGNKDHYNNQIDHLDYYSIELVGYHKLSRDFSLGLGIRQTENYKSERWSPGQTYMLYGVYFMSLKNVKIKFANRLASRTYKTSDTQYGLDNITNVDFFARSTNKLPKPYLMDEVYSSLNKWRVQTIRLYGGLRLLKTQHFGVDVYYCYWKTRPAVEWRDYNVLGINTKFRI